MRGLYQGYFNHISREVNKIESLFLCGAIFVVIDSFFLDTVSSMGRFKGVKKQFRMHYVLLLYAFTNTANVELLSGQAG